MLPFLLGLDDSKVYVHEIRRTITPGILYASRIILPSMTDQDLSHVSLCSNRSGSSFHSLLVWNLKARSISPTVLMVTVCEVKARKRMVDSVDLGGKAREGVE